MGPGARRPVPDDDRGPTADLGRTITAALGWSLVNSLIARLGTVALGLFLARLLVPEDYGEFAVALVVLVVAQSMNELGVSVVVLRSATVEPGRTATTVAIASSIAMAGAIVATAPLVADAMGVPGATNLVRVFAIGIVVDGIASIPSVVLARHFLQKRRALADLVGFAGAAAVAVPSAVAGAGAWSLVVGTLVGNALSALVVVVVAPHRLRPGWSASEARALVAAGLPFASTSLLAIAILNADYVVVGRTLGSARLGAYLLAFNLASWPVNLLSVAVRRIAVPAFAQLAAGGRLSDDDVARSMQLLGALAGMVAVSVSMLAEQVVELLYGSNWSDAVGAVRWLAVLGAIRVVVDLADDLLTALGRARDLVVCQASWLVALGPALWIGAHGSGLEGVAVAHVVVAVVVVVPGRLAALRRASIRTSAILRRMTAPVAAAVAATVVLGVVDPSGRSPLASIAVLGPLGVVVFGVALLLGMSVTVADRRALLRAGRRLRRAGSSSR